MLDVLHDNVPKEIPLTNLNDVCRLVRFGIVGESINALSANLQEVAATTESHAA